MVLFSSCLPTLYSKHDYASLYQNIKSENSYFCYPTRFIRGEVLRTLQLSLEPGSKVYRSSPAWNVFRLLFEPRYTTRRDSLQSIIIIAQSRSLMKTRLADTGITNKIVPTGNCLLHFRKSNHVIVFPNSGISLLISICMTKEKGLVHHERPLLLSV